MNEPRQSFLARGGGWVVSQIILTLAVIVSGQMFHSPTSRPPVMVTGAVLLALGGGFGIAGSLVLGRSLTPFPQPRTGSKLKQGGIYARVRHPLYTGVMLASLGWALLRQSRAAFFAALVLIVFFQIKARREERRLRERFSEYADYACRVPRFLPELFGRTKVRQAKIKNDS